jgi:uncharacterized protein (UPF0248 family)
MKKWETVHEHRGYKIIILNGAEVGDCMDYMIEPTLHQSGVAYSNIGDAVEAIENHLVDVGNEHDIPYHRAHVETYRKHKIGQYQNETGYRVDMGTIRSKEVQTTEEARALIDSILKR